MSLVTKSALLVVAACTILSPLSAVGAESSLKGKKIIEYGWDTPNSAYVREHVASMEKIAFDGITISDGHGWRAWSRNKMSPTEMDEMTANIKATKFKRFTDNFIPLISFFPDNEKAVDWFDPEWSSIAYNASIMARAAKRSGCKGILFDAEQYGDYKMWEWDSAKVGHSFEEYRTQVKERGKEFIRAINKEYPDITVHLLWGYEMPVIWDGPNGQRSGILLAAFLDGMCEAATDKTIIVDGFEYAYGYISRDWFKKGREMVMETAKNKYSTSPEAFEKHVRMAFPVYIDFWTASFFPFDYVNVERNLMTPEYVRAALSNALAETDKYVWVYTEHFRWWDRTTPEFPATAPKAYIEALKLARSGPGSAKVPQKLNWASPFHDFSSEDWKYSVPGDSSVSGDDWVKKGYDDSAWQTAKINDSKAPSTQGSILYRIKLNVPSIPKDQRTFIHVGTSADQIYVWLNGKYVGVHDMTAEGPYKLFAMEITDQVAPGKDNLLAIKTVSGKHAGGLINKGGLVYTGYEW